MCRAELRLNRRTAPLLYEKVCAIRRGPDGALALVDEAVADAVDDGEVLDWVVVMRRFEPGSEFDRLAARGALDLDLVRRLAAIVARFHRGEPPVQGHGGAAGLRAVVAENRREFERQAGVLPATEAETLDRACLDALAPLATLLDRRAAEGRVRRCHGDLHLGNLCLWEGRPVAFDALEFDEALASVDVGYELAFLLMDLDVKVSRDAANRVMNRVLGRSGDVGLLGALPFWMAQRALVRAKLAPARGQDGRPYLAAAEAFLAPVAPRCIAIGGLQGTGKTWLARRLAPHLGVAPGALHLRSDEARKRRAGRAPEQTLPGSAYDESESRAVHAEIFAASRAALAAGHSVVLDAVFLDPAMREAARDAAGDAPFTGFWLEAPMDVLRARVAARRGDASDATVAVLERAARVAPGTIAWQRLDAAVDSLPDALAELGLKHSDGAP
jgi:aminoglycoside phosphotransferase family enzyme/predicted kinase